MQVRIILPQTYPICETNFIYKTKSYKKLRMPYIPIFELTKQIQLFNDLPYFQSLLQLLNEDKKYFNVQYAEQIIKIGLKYFRVNLEIDRSDLSTKLLSYIVNKDFNIDFKVLNSLLINTLNQTVMKVFDIIQNQRTFNLFREIIEKYISTCNRSQAQKDQLKGLIKLKVIQKKFNTQKTLQKKQFNQVLKHQIKPQPQKKEFRNNQSKEKRRNYNNNSNNNQKYNSDSSRSPDKNSNKENYQNQSKKNSKKINDQISLGIYGDSNQGWRQRNRPFKIPIKIISKQNIIKPSVQQQNEQIQQNVIITNDKKIEQQKVKIEQSVKKDTNKTNTVNLNIAQQQIKQVNKNATGLPLLFKLDKNNKKFNFKNAKLPILVNIEQKNIQILMDLDFIEILNDGNGYRRNTSYTFVDNGIIAQGLTLVIDGQCNIQDGGKIIGDIKKCKINFNDYFTANKISIYKK